MTDRENLDALVAVCERMVKALEQLGRVMDEIAGRTRPKRLAEEKRAVARNYRGIATNLRHAVAKARGDAPIAFAR